MSDVRARPRPTIGQVVQKCAAGDVPAPLAARAGAVIAPVLAGAEKRRPRGPSGVSKFFHDPKVVHQEEEEEQDRTPGPGAPQQRCAPSTVSFSELRASAGADREVVEP